MLVSAKGLSTLRFVGRQCFFAKAVNSSVGRARLFSQAWDPNPIEDKEKAATRYPPFLFRFCVVWASVSTTRGKYTI